MLKVICGSFAGAWLISMVTVMSLVSVIGLSILAGVRITGFSIMSFVLSVGFSVEYSVHIVSRWLRAPMFMKDPLDRVHYTMSFLTLPTFMSFVSSTIGAVTLAFTQFEFTQVFFFRPLIIVMFVTYYFGCWWLPAFLSILNFDFVKLGHAYEVGENTSIVNNKEVVPEMTEPDKRRSDNNDSLLESEIEGRLDDFYNTDMEGEIEC